MRDTAYAKELASSDIADCRIERIHVKGSGQDEIRFAWWPGGRMANRPLDMPEPDLLKLMEKAIADGVFSPDFLQGLLKALAAKATF